MSLRRLRVQGALACALSSRVLRGEDLTSGVAWPQVDTFQYSCLLPKDTTPQSPATQFAILYTDTFNSSNTFSLLSCPDPTQYLVVIKVSTFGGSSRNHCVSCCVTGGEIALMTWPKQMVDKVTADHNKT